MVQARYRIGQRLPPERELAKTFGVLKAHDPRSHSLARNVRYAAGA